MDLKINHWYRFDTYAPSILGTQYTRMKLVMEASYSFALEKANVELLGRQVQPLLPPGTPTNRRNYTYYVFVSPDGSKQIVLASYWIIEESLEEVQEAKATIHIENIDTSDVNAIRDQLRAMGYTFQIEVS